MKKAIATVLALSLSGCIFVTHHDRRCGDGYYWNGNHCKPTAEEKRERKEDRREDREERKEEKREEKRDHKH
jgi:hypothetical protein